MNDDQLAQELQRRAESAASRPDWVRRDLLPAVRHQIDARPQRVMTSNWSPRLGVAALVAALLIMVIAVPRLAPQPPSATSTPPLALVMSTADFGIRLASGSLDGQTVLVDGGIVAYDGPPIYGPVCGAGSGRACLIGQLDGISPRVEVSSPDIAVASSDDSSVQVSPGWPWWTRVTPPVNGTLLLSVDDLGGVEYIGRVKLDRGQLIWSVADASALDVNSLARDEVALVNGWLGGTPSDQVHCAAIPADQQIESRLPSRQCTDEWIAQAADASSALVQVQPGAYPGLAPNPSSGSAGSYQARQGLYALAIRLEGWCQSGAPPCWQWNVVASVDPVSAVPTASPAPGPDTVLSAADFAAGVSSGALDGRVVLVEGKVSVPAAPPASSFPCDPPDGVCGLGVLDGTDPPVYVDTSYKPTTDTPGSGTWAGGDGGRDYHFPSVPIEGVLALLVMPHNHAFFLGIAGQDGAAPVRSVAEAQAIDISTVTLDQVVLVRGRLSTKYSPGTVFDCATPPFPDLVGLPSRYCVNTGFLRGPNNAGLLQVQEDAIQFAPAQVEQAAVYAISPRLYGGGCGGAPPCWQWDVVARLNGPPDVPASATPTTIECATSGGLPITLTDATGTVAACRSLAMSFQDLGDTVLVSNQRDLSRLHVELSANRCIRGVDAQFSLATNGYALVITEGEAVPGCEGPRVSVGFELDLRTDIAASTVTATLASPQSTASPAPSPSPEPVVRQIDCPLSPESGEPDLAPKVSAVDTTGIFNGCAAFAGAPEYLVIPWDAPIIRNSSPTQLQVIWATTTCDHAVQLDVTLAGVRVQLTNRTCSYRARQGQYVQLDFSVPVDAANFPGTIVRASGEPDPDPPATARPTGDPALVGQTLACPYSDPSGRTTEMSLIDHAGVVAGCHASLVSEAPSEPVVVANALDQLIVTWDVGAVCGALPAQLELWGPRYKTRGYTDGVLTDFDLWIDRSQESSCYGPVATQRVVLDLSVPVSHDEVNAFVTTGVATSTDRAEVPDAVFDFSLSADGTDFAADQPIDVVASLTYTGDAASMTVSGASEYIVFGIEQLDGLFETRPISALLCGEETLQSGVPDVRQFYKLGGYSNSDPEVERYRAYFADPQLRLPPGTYRISSGVGFQLGAGTCHDHEGGVGVGTSIVIHVH